MGYPPRKGTFSQGVIWVPMGVRGNHPCSLAMGCLGTKIVLTPHRGGPSRGGHSMGGVPHHTPSPPGRTPKVKNVFCFKIDAKSVPEALAALILILLTFSIDLAHR